MKRYALGCAFNSIDLFMNLDLKRLLINCNQCMNLIHTHHRDKLAIKIFRENLKLVIKDIVENNVTFWFPLNNKAKCNMHMKMFEGKELKDLRRKGKWQDIDIFLSDFKCYAIKLFMYGNRTSREKFVYVNKEYRDIITEKTNNGFLYGDGPDKYLSDYLDLMYELFPEVSKNDIKIILRFGWKSLYLHNSYGGDTLIKYDEFWCYIGNLKKNPLEHYYYYIRKLCVKIRVLYRKKKIPWDGYYYFALSEKLYEYYTSLINTKGRKRKKFNYGNVFLYEILDECKVNEHAYKYIFRVPFISRLKLKNYIKNFESDKAELIITREPLKFKDISVFENEYKFI